MGHQESDTTERLTLTRSHTHILVLCIVFLETGQTIQLLCNDISKDQKIQSLITQGRFLQSSWSEKEVWKQVGCYPNTCLGGYGGDYCLLCLYQHLHWHGILEIHINSSVFFPSHYGLLQSIECSSLCSTRGPCCLSTLYVIVCMC